VVDIVTQKNLLYADVIGNAELCKLIGRYEFPEHQISAGTFFELFNYRSLALGISISAIASGIEVFCELLVRCMERSVLRRKIEVKKNVISFSDTALKTSCELFLLGRVTGIAAGNYGIKSSYELIMLWIDFLVLYDIGFAYSIGRNRRRRKTVKQTEYRCKGNHEAQ